MEWFAILGIFSSLWIAMITGILDFPFVLEWQQTILFLPLILLVLFGLYANFIIMYRVFTFNDCEDAAIELQQVSSYYIKSLIH